MPKPTPKTDPKPPPAITPVDQPIPEPPGNLKAREEAFTKRRGASPPAPDQGSRKRQTDRP